VSALTEPEEDYSAVMPPADVVPGPVEPEVQIPELQPASMRLGAVAQHSLQYPHPFAGMEPTPLQDTADLEQSRVTNADMEPNHIKDKETYTIVWILFKKRSTFEFIFLNVSLKIGDWLCKRFWPRYRYFGTR
jgi:hypothetical protein